MFRMSLTGLSFLLKLMLQWCKEHLNLIVCLGPATLVSENSACTKRYGSHPIELGGQNTKRNIVMFVSDMLPQPIVCRHMLRPFSPAASQILFTLDYDTSGAGGQIAGHLAHTLHRLT